jgi:hypothetical protein
MHIEAFLFCAKAFLSVSRMSKFFFDVRQQYCERKTPNNLSSDYIGAIDCFMMK